MRNIGPWRRVGHGPYSVSYLLNLRMISSLISFIALSSKMFTVKISLFNFEISFIAKETVSTETRSVLVKMMVSGFSSRP